MESGAIVDSQISASTIWDANHAAHQARLHFKVKGLIRGGWSSLPNDNNQWLQVDLQQTTRVTRIATQGRNGHPQWVTKYKLQYGEDGHTFRFYRRIGEHSDTVWYRLSHLNHKTSLCSMFLLFMKVRFNLEKWLKWYIDKDITLSFCKGLLFFYFTQVFSGNPDTDTIAITCKNQTVLILAHQESAGNHACNKIGLASVLKCVWFGSESNIFTHSG